MPQHDARARSRASGSASPGAGSFKERFVALRTLRPFVVMVWKTSPSLTFFSLLLRLARGYGRPIGPELRLDLRLSQKDLATLVGASREKVNRQLRRWQANGTLVLERGYIRICKPEVLAAG